MNLNNWKKQLLDGKWELVWSDNDSVEREKLSITTYEQMNKCGLSSISASVPGNFELDLYKAGIIDDPYFGLNTLKMQEFENKHVWYGRKFDYSGNENGDTYICFEGIDTFADIYLNGEKIASTANMLIPHEIKVCNLKIGSNDVVVHIKPTCMTVRNKSLAPGNMALRYNYESLYIRKAAHMFGWDIMPRIVSSGIWKSVYILQKPKDRIEDVYIYTASIDKLSSTALICAFFNVNIMSDSLKGYKLKINGVCKDSEFAMEHDFFNTTGEGKIQVENCQYWQPIGTGEQNLYDTVIELSHNGKLIDTYTLKVGIRTVEIIRRSPTDETGNGEFCFKVNGEKLFIKGTNWVPVDAFHSRDKERLPRHLDLIKEIGCNAVRCWGGNVYENELFYDYCDENGILVWQDFGMACGVYPQSGEFVNNISNEVKTIVKLLRNHSSIALWAGDNECDQAYSWGGLNLNPNSNTITRKIIPDILNLQDPARYYLPSSPYIDETAFKEGSSYLPEDHLWGARDYFKSNYYTESKANFASEIGYHGCPSPESIRKFISKDKLWPWKNNEEWIVHAASPEKEIDSPYAYRIELMAKQIEVLFGTIPDNLNDFAMASQISQAEAFKYFIEIFRIAKWKKTGIIWWNLIDGWPQFSDAVVDYFYCKKLAYDYIKSSQQPVCLMFSDPKNEHFALIACNDTNQKIKLSYKVKDISDQNRVILEADIEVNPNISEQIANLNYCMREQHFYLIEWKYDNVTGKNHYLAGTPAFDFQKYLDCLKAADLYSFEGFND